MINFLEPIRQLRCHLTLRRIPAASEPGSHANKFAVRFVLFSREDKGSCDFLDYGFNNYALRITNSALKKGGPSKVWEALKDV